MANDPPVFALQSYGPTVAEDAAVGTAVGAPLQASDPNGDAITYTLSGDGAHDFAVGADGQIKVAATLDHESRDSYALVSTASDPAGGADSMDVTITVTNVEETGTVEFDSTGQPEVNNPLTATLADPDGNVADETWTWDRGKLGRRPMDRDRGRKRTVPRPDHPGRPLPPQGHRQLHRRTRGRTGHRQCRNRTPGEARTQPSTRLRRDAKHHQPLRQPPGGE